MTTVLLTKNTRY